MNNLIISREIKIKWYGFAPTGINEIALLIPQFNEVARCNFWKRLEYFKAFATKYKKQIDVIIIDDGSTDDSLKIIKAFLTEFPNAFYVAIVNPNSNKVGALHLTILNIYHSLVILSDFDTDIVGINNVIINKREFLADENLMGGFFRLLPTEGEGIVYRYQQLEYSLHRALYQFSRKENKVKVMPGAGSWFKRNILIDIYNRHSGYRNGEDRESTTIGLECGFKVEYCQSTHALTRPPLTYSSLIKQRVRWNLGYIETICKEKKYYFAEIKRGSSIGILTAIDILFILIVLLFPLTSITILLRFGIIDFAIFFICSYLLFIIQIVSLFISQKDEFKELKGNIVKTSFCFPFNKLFIDNIAWFKAAFLYIRNYKKDNKVVEKAENINSFDASELQLQYWQFHNRDGNVIGSNIFISNSMHNSIDIDSLRKSLGIVVARHQALRSCFSIMNSKLKMHVFPNKAEYSSIDIYDLNNDECKSLSEEFLLDKKIRDISNLAKAPLFKIFVCRISNGKYKLFLLVHHIIADGVSIDILKNELRSVYKSIINKDAVQIPIHVGQLGDYCNKQLHFRKNKQQEFKNFWSRKFSFLPTIAPNMDTETKIINKLNTRGRSGSYIDHLDLSTYNLLKNRAKLWNSSFWSLLYGSIAFTLGEALNQRKIIIATSVSDRHMPEYKYTIGNLIGAVYLVVESDIVLKNIVKKIHIDLLRSSRYIIYNNTDLEQGKYNLRLASTVFVNLEPFDKTINVKRFRPDDMGHHEEEGCYYPLIFGAVEYEEGIILKWFYHKDFYDSDMIEKIATLHKSTLVSLAFN